jgi:murein DD-endopeptidase MepM/ murein hydrolase activator NlpD
VPGGGGGDLPIDPPGGGGGGGGGGAGGGGGGGDAPSQGPGSVAPGTEAGGQPGPAGRKAGETKRERQARKATPMVAGTDAVRALLDDENSPELLAASQAFLTADQGIAEIARQKKIMARLQQTAEEQVEVYEALGYDVIGAQAKANALHQQHDALSTELATSARSAYVSGRPTDQARLTPDLTANLVRLGDASTRADLRVGDLTVRRALVKAEYDGVVARFTEAKRALKDANKLLAALAAQRDTAIDAIFAARGSDLALNRARIAESGQLGAQIRALSAQLQRSGRTVQGTGDIDQPVSGHVTSPFGMRFHPILRYNKLHTGTDFAGGDPAILAADDGRVLMTVVSPAYGLFTVIDHGFIAGKRVTTAYAHQSAFLVKEGQAVTKGEQIGVVGSTGYSTGPHLHFEVRENGTVVDPVRYIAERGHAH